MEEYIADVERNDLSMENYIADVKANGLTMESYIAECEAELSMDNYIARCDDDSGPDFEGLLKMMLEKGKRVRNMPQTLTILCLETCVMQIGTGNFYILT